MQVELNDPSLLKSNSYIGEWCNANNGTTFNVKNPATDQVIVSLPNMDDTDTVKAIDLAANTFKSWRKTTVDERAKLLRTWASLIRENVNDIAKIMTLEQGKPLTESVGEINYSAGFLDWFADEAQRPSGRIIPPHNNQHRLMVTHEPLGVGATITPWNFPSLMVLRDVGPALAAGNTIVLKPADLTPLTPLAFAVLAERAGIPPGVFSVVTTAGENTPIVGNVITKSEKVNKISFTGSTKTGILLAKSAADTVTRMGLELGGNAPFIVFDDADIDAALDGLIASKFRNCGQACVATNRIFIQEGIYDEFNTKLKAKVEALKVGNGMDEDVEVGPLINEGAAKKMEEFIADALSKGGKLVAGGKPHALGHSFFEPTLIVDATDDMLPCQCEIFGPLAMVSKFKTEAEAIERANNTIHGLAAYFYSGNRERCWRVSEALESGIVCENTVAFSSARTPFGGFKQSGVGRDGGAEGLHEWQEIKYRCIGGLS